MTDVRHTSQWRKARTRAFRRHDGICYLCGTNVERGMIGDYSPEVDHIIPVSRGGAPYEDENLAVVHRLCNRIKGQKSAEELQRGRSAQIAIKNLQTIERSDVDFLSYTDEVYDNGPT